MGRLGGIAVAVVLSAAVALGQVQTPQRVEISTLRTNGSNYTDQPVTVVGQLPLASANYMKDARFVVIDAAGNDVAVTAWLPLEIPPAPRGRDTKRPATMRDFLNTTVIVTGIFRSTTARGNLIDVQTGAAEKAQ